MRPAHLLKLLHMEHPIIQAPMGGATTVDLVVESSNAGALGFIAAAYLDPDQIAATAAQVRKRTARPFGINLFAPVPEPPEPSQSEPERPQPAEPAKGLEILGRFHAEMGLTSPQPPSPAPQPFERQLPSVLASGASVFSFTFGIPGPAALDALRAAGMFLMGTATTVAEAIALERAGVDAVIAQGMEAGAHRGTFQGSFEDALIGTVALVPQIADAVSLPVVASGGIMDGRGIAAALALGADAVQMGTAFLACHEAGIPESYKDLLLSPANTRITRAFSGRPARGIPNRFMDTFDAEGPGAILPYPLQNALTRPLRNAAARADNPDYLSLWAGQAHALATRSSARDLILRLSRETQQAIAGLQRAV